MTNITTTTRTERILGRLNLCATLVDVFGPWLDDRDDTLSYYVQDGGASIGIFLYGDDTRELMRTVRKNIGGKWDKKVTSYDFAIERVFGDPNNSVTIRVSAAREAVCEKRVTGQTTRTIEAVPARTITEDIVEWDCGTLLDD